MRATAPASSANLGPGFDALGLALSLHVTVEVREADAFSIATTGEGSDLPADRTHLAARIAIETAGHDRLAITVASDIPVGRGLGSSASLAGAAAAAAGAHDPLAWGQRIDHHPENAGASVLGGLVAATVVDGRPIAVRLPLDPDLTFVVLVPDHELKTDLARQALPERVPLADAAFNLSRLGVLVAGFADRGTLRPELFEDRLHQPARAAALYPEAPGLLAGLVGAGALGACWSGAGPTLLAVCDGGDAADRVRTTGEDLLRAAGLAGRALVLAPDTDGLVVER
jgi:homoserine kinase